eukprot:7177541-Prymnesium_polylepis.1
MVGPCVGIGGDAHSVVSPDGARVVAAAVDAAVSASPGTRATVICRTEDVGRWRLALGSTRADQVW